MGFVTNSQLKQEQQAFVDNLKKGKLIPSNSVSAKSLDPVSEESGTIQDEPFIAQGTGTANNTASVDVPPVAQQLEKQGNTVVENNWFGRTSNYSSTFAAVNITYTASTGIVKLNGTSDAYSADYYFPIKRLNKTHHYLGVMEQVGGTASRDSSALVMIGGIGTYSLYVGNSPKILYGFDAVNDPKPYLYAENGAVFTNAEYKIYLIDLEQYFNGDIPQDLLDNPSHYAWYMTLGTYNEGSLVNSSGVKLVCTGRNIFDNNWVAGRYDGDGQPTSEEAYLRNGEPIVIVPNKPFRLLTYSSCYILYYDGQMNYLGYEVISSENSFTPPASARYINLFIIGNIARKTTISLYYSPAEGGEGYNQHYNYQEPKVYDTGTEELLASINIQDTKLPSGEITHNVYRQSLTVNSIYVRAGNENVDFAIFTLSKAWKTNNLGAVFDKGTTVSDAGFDTITETNKYLIYDTGNKQIAISVSKGTTKAQAEAIYNGTYIQYNLATPTTEQGTTFSENIEDDDYGMMYWLDTDNELVETPQGCKIFYPANYSLWLDTAYARTEGDATDIALTSEISDAALNARGYYKMQDLLSSVIAGYNATKTQILSHNQGTLTWVDSAATQSGSEVTIP